MGTELTTQIEETEEQFRSRLERVKKIANRRFAKLEMGEHVTNIEIKNRLKEISDAGWYVLPYNKMNNKELWNYLMQLKKDVWFMSIRPAYFDR